MANTKSAAKQARVNLRRKAINRAAKNEIKTIAKKFHTLIAAGDKAGASKLLGEAQSKLDKAAKTKTIHRNKASRAKARLAKLVK